ncbi:15800_t:CDS:1, partial [Dentiscutata heterogama]
NMVIMPGFCVAGTVGAKVLNGDKEIQVDAYNKVQVNLQVKNLSFSAHADAKGIMQLIKQCAPKNVMLVHGEKAKMEFLQDKIRRECRVPCTCPANGETVTIETPLSIPVDISVDLLKRHLNAQKLSLPLPGERIDLTKITPVDEIPIQGVLVMESDRIPRLIEVEEAIREARLPILDIDFKTFKTFDPKQFQDKNVMSNIEEKDIRIQVLEYVYEVVNKAISKNIPGIELHKGALEIKLRSVTVSVPEMIKDEFKNALRITWNSKDQNLADFLISIMDDILPDMPDL